MLLTPGPVTVDAAVLEALARPVRPHYGPAWAERYGEVRRALATVFGTEAEVILTFGPGTAALEMGVTSVLAAGDEIVIPNTGRFAQRLIDVARATRLSVRVVDVALHQPISASALDDALTQHPEARAVAIVHHETGLGLLNPLSELCQVVRAHGVLNIVDTVSTLGGVEIAMDELGIDVCAGVANKCLGAPIGVAPLAVSARAWRAVDDGRPKAAGWYLNLASWRRAMTERPLHPHPTTMATSLVEALGVAVEQLLAGGLDRAFERHRNAANAVRAGVRELGFELVVDDAIASPLTTAVFAQQSMDVAAYTNWLETEHGLLIAGAFDELAGEAFRVGHMGAASRPEAVERYLEATRTYMRQNLSR